ncbi:DUF874 family protein [Helicobacter pylori]|uniref:DUF874 family protein n=1 Tax=Helicobacter pylori TaxID=210 RepID=UPI001931C8CA|nr:DUF874 family protein [Helicobacter pylori]MBM0603773.1 DUF874 family protein [Helicobacter pylori]MBM0613906.1 DUF874 family protein [Helicobacter pylori]MBM0616376.1 DUF874 family protein [Helicobacter pylori]MBM0616850.1 DUF874 family protein [Helicobacter pylori]MBM0629047.1 DUF874 family protein [Helicobacter pylori]
MESVKTGKTNKVGKNTETANTKANKETHFKQASAITNTLRSISGFFTKIVKKVRELVKKHPKKSRAALVVLTHVACRKAKELDDKVQDKSKQAEKENQINWWKYSGLTIAASLLLAACSAGDIDKQIELEQEKQKTEQEQQKTEQERQKANKSEIELEQERQKTNKSGIELANSQIKAEQERQKTEQEKQKANKSEIELEQQKQKTINTQRDLIKEQKDFIKETEQNCQEKHGQLFIKKARIKTGITTGIAIEIEAECKTPKPTKTNQTPIQPKHLPNSKQPRSQRGSKAQEFIAYLQKELESLPYSQKAIAKQVDFYKPSSIAYLELDPRDFNATEEWQKENLKIRSKAQAKMLEMRHLKPDSQAHLSTSQSLLFVQKIFADISKEIKVVANTEKKVEKVSYGYSKRM